MKLEGRKSIQFLNVRFKEWKKYMEPILLKLGTLYCNVTLQITLLSPSLYMPGIDLSTVLILIKWRAKN